MLNNESFCSLMMNRFLEAKENIAFRQYDGNKINEFSYKKLYDDILLCTSFFIEHNIRNTTISILLDNSYEWAVMFFSVLASGNVAFSLNKDLSCNDLNKIIFDADSNIVIISKANEEMFKNLNIDRLDIDTIFAGGNKKITCKDIYISNKNETIAMLETSGTTGKRKIAEFTSNNLCFKVKNYEHYSWHEKNSMFMYPNYHVGGMAHAILYLYDKKTLCTGRGSKYFSQDMCILNPESIWFVPTLLDGIVKILQINKNMSIYDFLGKNIKKIFVGGAKANEETLKYIYELGIQIVCQYGMTELVGSCLLGEIENNNFETHGKPWKACKMKIENGELLVKGECVFKGYYHNDEETKKVIINGWLHTGDLAKKKNGYIYVVGRKKNIIILANGENVNPEEIENELNKSPDIIECKVYSDDKGICADIYALDKEKALYYVTNYNHCHPKYLKINKTNYINRPIERTTNGKIKR